jgi:hypothetical protein
LRALLVLALAFAAAACSEWNERTARFATYAEYAASDSGPSRALPADLVPRSARDIVVKQNIDTTEVEATFSFAPADQAALVEPFLSYDQRQLRIAEREGAVPAGTLASPSLMLRCGPGPMEFLQLEGQRARYWTSVDRERRAESCTNRAASSGL